MDMNNQAPDGNFCLTTIAFILGKHLSDLQQVSLDDSQGIRTKIIAFKRLCNGIKIKDLVENLADKKVEEKYWRKIYKTLSENLKTPIKVEEDDQVVVVTNQPPLPPVVTSLPKNVIGSSAAINPYQMVGMTTSSTHSDDVSNTLLDTNSNHSPNLNKKKKSSSTSTSTPYSSSSSDDSQQQPKKRKPKRKTPERAAKTRANTMLNEEIQYEALEKYYSDDESVDHAPPSKSTKSERRQSPSSSSSKKKSTQAEIKPQLQPQPPQTEPQPEPPVQLTEQQQQQENLKHSWKTTLEYLKKNEQLPDLDKIKVDIKNASIKSSQATGYNYAKMVKNTVPAGIKKLWKDYPMLFYLVSHKILQDISGIAKILTTVFEENAELRDFYKRKPCYGCPNIDKLHTLA